MSLKRVVISLVGMIIILTAIFIAVSFLGGEGGQAKPVILKTIELRNNIKDPVAKAKLITDINKATSSIGSKVISDEWSKLTSCLIEECSDDNYFNFIIVVASEKKDEIPFPELINNLIIINRYWGGEMILEFSNAMSLANDEIALIKSRNIRKQWDDIIACNGECEEFNNLFFEILSSIVMLK